MPVPRHFPRRQIPRTDTASDSRAWLKNVRFALTHCVALASHAPEAFASSADTAVTGRNRWQNERLGEASLEADVSPLTPIIREGEGHRLTSPNTDAVGYSSIDAVESRTLSSSRNLDAYRVLCACAAGIRNEESQSAVCLPKHPREVSYSAQKTLDDDTVCMELSPPQTEARKTLGSRQHQSIAGEFVPGPLITCD
ncbi:hypothetical protein MTO96_039611 [Rhipicephalus appendiculatus]